MINMSYIESYIYNNHIAHSHVYNLDLKSSENRVIDYNNILYLCSVKNDELLFSPYEPNVWNKLTSNLKSDEKLDVLIVSDIDYKYTILPDNAIEIPEKTTTSGISLFIPITNEFENKEIVFFTLKNINQNNIEIIIVHEKSVHEKSVHENSLHENSLHENSLHENSAHENSLHEKSVHENCMTIERFCKTEKIKNVFVYDYVGGIIDEDPKTKFYNWCIEKCNKWNFIKWNSNFLVIPTNFIYMMEEYNINSIDGNFAVWFTGKTLYKYNNNHFILAESRYNEFRIFSKKHGAKYITHDGSTKIDENYLKDSKRIIYTKCVFLEYRIINKTFVTRDEYEHGIVHRIMNNMYTEYKNRLSFFSNIIKMPRNLLFSKSTDTILRNLTVTNFELAELQNYWINNYIKNDENKVIFKHPENIVIQGLWVGNRLGTIHNMCVESFVRNSHMYVLYTYENVDNVPDNVVIMDGNEITPEILIYKFSDSYAGFSNLFRNALLYQKGGWYVDLDIYNVKRYDFPRKNIFSLDYYPAISDEKVEIKKRRKTIIGTEYYVASNPVKSEKKDPIFLDQFKYILDKILFGKLQDLLPQMISKEMFVLLLIKNNLDNLFYSFYKTGNKRNVTFLDLLRINKINSKNVRQKYWGELGPILCTRSVINNNRMHQCAKPELFQGIIKYNEIYKFFDKNIDYGRLKNTYSIDLFFTMWKQQDMLKRLDDEDKITNSLIYDMLHFNALSQ